MIKVNGCKPFLNDLCTTDVSLAVSADCAGQLIHFLNLCELFWKVGWRMHKQGSFVYAILHLSD